jgi:hypothetical protein
MRIFLLLILSLGVYNAKSAIISGKVSDVKGNGLSFASVFIKGTTIGVTTNIDGNYSIQLEEGTYELVFQYVGYIKKNEIVTVAKSNIVLNVTLESDKFSLKEIVIAADAEDPAYRVIRNAIKRRKYFLQQVDEFKCNVYIKGVQQLDSLPKRIMGLKAEGIGLDSSMLGIVYLSESESEFNFKQTDKIREVMKSSKVSGDNKAFSYNQASDFDFNFYKNLLDVGSLSDRGFVSPISETAMLYYKYKMMGAFYEDGLLINKIQVIPRRKSDPVFSGYIYIIEDQWRIYSTDLWLSKEAKIDFVDSLNLLQTYAKVSDSIWMAYNQNMYFWFKAFGIKGKGRYIGVFNNYNVAPNFPKKFFKGEELKVNDDANTKDSLYWDSNRPIPLTQEEVNDYRKKDSLARLQNSKPYLDSLDRKRNKFQFSDIILGYSYYKRFNKTNRGVQSLLQLANYNTVEGFAPNINIYYTKQWEDRKYFKADIDLRYGFSNQLFSYKPEIIYLFKPEKFRRIKLEGGSYVFQFNQEKPISGFVNSIYTLGLEKNYLKIYRNQFVKGSYYTELINGLNGGLSISYNQRSPLYNSTAFTFNDGDDFFIPNDPLIQELISPDKKTNALIAELKFDIHFKQKYYTRPHEKVIIGSKFPSLEILYRKGMNEVDFDFVEATIKDDVKIGLLGLSEYNISAGYFLNANIVSKADMKHFNGNQTILAPVNHLTSFQLLPYYYYSTQNYFLEAHYEHHFGGFILNKIPLLRKLNLKEVAGIHYLKTKEINYAEINIGLENLFKILRVDWVTSYSNTLQLTSGIRIGLNLFGGAVSISKE